MKITCQSCQAKYTIADEKVAGKTVKIKCKKCGATIVVNGADGSTSLSNAAIPVTGSTGVAIPVASLAPQMASAPPGDDDEGDGATRVFAEGGGSGLVEWTVNVTDEDQRTMNAAQIVAEYQRGVVNDDTYVWKDGMADWLPISGVPELSSMVRGQGPRPAAGMPAPVVAAPVMAPAAMAAAPMAAAALPEPSGGLGGTMIMTEPTPMAAAPMAAAPMAAAPMAAAPMAAAPAAAARRKPAAGSGGVDLFAPSAGPAPAAAPMATTSHDRLVGERNENSVLFSISALTAAAAANKADHDALLDLASPSPPPRNGSRGGGGGGGTVDDIMNLGGGMSSAPMLAPPALLAPVVEAPPPPPPQMMIAPAMGNAMVPDYPQKKSKAGLIIGAVAAVLLIGGVGAFALMGGSKDNTDPNAALSAAVGSATPSAVASAAPSATPTATVAAVDTAAPANTVAPSDAKSAQPTAQVDKTKVDDRKTDAKKADDKKADDKKADDKKADAKKADDKKADDKKADTGGAGKEFDRAAALASLGGAAGGARACKTADGPTGSGKVKVTFAPSGAATSVTLESGPFAGTPLAGCIIGAFRGARVPPFDGSPVSVSKSFSIN